MKKNKNLITLISIITITIITTLIYAKNTKYEYICFNKDISIGEVIKEEYLTICKTNKKINNDIIINKSQLLTKDENQYRLINRNYKEGEKIYIKDFELINDTKKTSTDIALLNEVEVLNHGTSEDDLTRYKTYIKNKKLYAINLTTNEEKIIFEQEDVKNIAIRPYCCTGNTKLIILTTNGNLYISNKDCTYSFNFDITFTKLNTTNITNLKLVSSNQYENINSLYGINSSGEEILIEEPA